MAGPFSRNHVSAHRFSERRDFGSRAARPGAGPRSRNGTIPRSGSRDRAKMRSRARAHRTRRRGGGRSEHIRASAALRHPFRRQRQYRCRRHADNGRVPRLRLYPGRNCAGCGATAGRRRGAGRQDQPRSVRDGLGRHALALWRAAQSLRCALHSRRVEFRLGGGGRSRASSALRSAPTRRDRGAFRQPSTTSSG